MPCPYMSKLVMRQMCDRIGLIEMLLSPYGFVRTRLALAPGTQKGGTARAGFPKEIDVGC